MHSIISPRARYYNLQFILDMTSKKGNHHINKIQMSLYRIAMATVNFKFKVHNLVQL